MKLVHCESDNLQPQSSKIAEDWSTLETIFSIQQTQLVIASILQSVTNDQIKIQAVGLYVQLKNMQRCQYKS